MSHMKKWLVLGWHYNIDIITILVGIVIIFLGAPPWLLFAGFAWGWMGHLLWWHMKYPNGRIK